GITSAGFIVGSITNSFSSSVAFGDVISQTPVAGTELALGSSINLNVSKGTTTTDFEDLVAFAQNWLDTNCGLCSDQDYSGDNDVDFQDFALFGQEWLLQPPATLVINEFMASNDTTIPDGFGEYDDWIEIYNYGPDPIVMDGMHLADAGNPCILPSGVTINAGQYLLFWADNQDTQGPLHTNFGLSAGGDEITLYDTDGVSIIDSITYRADQEADISHGRFPDNTPNWYNMADPTPGAANTAGMVGDVWFSKVSGTFTSSFNLELFTETPSATIRYTTNGDAPTSGSTAYSGPISIGTSGAARIRAQAYHATLAPGNVQSHYYIPIASDIQNFSSNLPIVILDTYGSAISEAQWAHWPSDRLFDPVSSTFIDVDKDTGLASMQDIPDYAGRAGMKTRGESSNDWPKKQFSLELWDENNIDEKHSLLGMPSESDWILNAPYGDKTLMRNVLAYKWGNDIMPGFAAPGTVFVEVFLNDDGGSCSYADYNGIYVLMEKLKISDNRLDIGKLTTTDNAEPEVTGGYLLRVDKASTLETFSSGTMVGTVQYYDPEGPILTSTQKSWIENHFANFEAVLDPLDTNPATGYPSYIETENFQETDVLLELFKNIDGFKLSTYFHKAKNGKISFGPLWDFNFSSGNCTNPYWGFWASYSKAANIYDYEDWWNDNFGVYGWHSRLMNDFEYKLGTADKWFEHREDKLSDAQIVADIDNNYTYLTSNVAFSGGADVSCNYYHGNNSTEPEQGNIPHTYHMEKEWLKNWFTGQGTSAPGEFYISDYTDRAGIVDAFWDSNRNITGPPALYINGSPMDTGGSITAGDTLTMTASTPGTIYYTLDGTDPRAAGGAVAGLSYSSGITLNETKQVKARIRDGSGNWSALNEAIFSDDRLAGSLRITEVMYNPVDPNDEYIEFTNIGPATVNLAHCELTKGVDFTFSSMTLAPGEYTIVTRNQAHFAVTYPGYSGTFAGDYLNDKLDNGGENIRLKDAAGNIIQQLDYEDGWFPITDGLGYSLNLMVLDTADPNDWDKRDNWQASNVLGGTPGADHIANTVGNEDVVINEILTHTDDSEGDWVELHNTTGSSIDVGNWYLSDN
ncbi:MAG: lamin tail domain-containing protein, partial [Planctomycetota bacterium]